LPFVPRVEKVQITILKLNTFHRKEKAQVVAQVLKLKRVHIDQQIAALDAEM